MTEFFFLKKKALGLQTLRQVCSFMQTPQSVLPLCSRICLFKPEVMEFLMFFKRNLMFQIKDVNKDTKGFI